MLSFKPNFSLSSFTFKLVVNKHISIITMLLRFWWPLIDLKLGKEYIKAVYCDPAYLTYMQSIMRDDKLDEAQAGIKIARRNINNLRYTEATNFMAESEEELKSLLMKVKEEGENVVIKPQY